MTRQRVHGLEPQRIDFLSQWDAYPTREQFTLILRLMHGTRMLAGECCRHSVKEIDRRQGLIAFKEGKGFGERIAPRPSTRVTTLSRESKAIATMSSTMSASATARFFPARTELRQLLVGNA